MAAKDIDTYLNGAPEYALPILTTFRAAVHEACPEVKEVIKWGFPCFEYKGLMCGMAAHKKHCSITFWKGVIMDDPEGILEVVGKTGMGSLGKIATIDDLPTANTLHAYLLHAVELQDSNIKPTQKKRSRTELTVPAVLEEALDQNPKARRGFDAFSYSNQKEYIEWIDNAKTDATRNRRLEQAIEWISEGKPRNWKYMK